MPELPEVETTIRGLRPVLAVRKIGIIVFERFELEGGVQRRLERNAAGFLHELLAAHRSSDRDSKGRNPSNPLCRPWWNPTPFQSMSNTATEKELRMVPGIGPVMATRIIAARPFRSANELKRVSGIGDKKYAQIRPYFQ